MTNFYIENKAETKTETSKIFEGARDLDISDVPGNKGEEYVCWGHDDQDPYKLQELVLSDEVLSADKLTNVMTCYGAGLQLVDKEGKETEDEGIQQWLFRNDMSSFFLNQCTDIKFFYFAVAVIILSADGKTINRLVHKDASNCRLQKADKNGKIGYVYYGDFKDMKPESVERIELLDSSDLYDDLIEKSKNPKARKFAVLMRYPTAGCGYYPMPYWTASLRGGSYDEKKRIMKAKLAKLKNYTSVKYHVEINERYYDDILEEEGITDAEAQQRRIEQEKENIKQFCLGTDNADKVWISKFKSEDGKVDSDVIIHRVEKEKEGGDWAVDVQSAVNTMCFADNVHPNLVGAVPGKSQTNNSGSDKRELFTMKQAMEGSFHDVLLRSIRLVIMFNGWKNIKAVVPMIQLTTLDEHRDAKKVTTEGGQDENQGN